MARIFRLLMIAYLGAQAGEACKCFVAHPQSQFCDSDFVLLANVVNETVHNEAEWSGKRIYDIELIHVFKGYGRSKIYTALQGATCGVRLEVGQHAYYVLSGYYRDGAGWIGSCNFQRKWSSVTRDQRRALFNGYSKNCDCKVCADRDRRCPTMSCMRPYDGNWKMTECLDKHSVCEKTCSHYGSCSTCGWSQNAGYRMCMSRP